MRTVSVLVLLFGSAQFSLGQCLPFWPPPIVIIQPVYSIPKPPAPKKEKEKDSELPKPKEVAKPKAMIREDQNAKPEEAVAPALRVHPRSKLNLPPDIGTATKEGPEPPKIEVKSPEWTVQVCPIDPPEGKTIPKDRKEVKVGFFNHSDRELWLEVNGESVGIPARNYVLTKVPPKFTWRYKNGSPNEVTIPNTSEGMDLIFR